MDQVQRTRLEEQRREVMREMQEVAMAMVEGSRTHGSFFTYYSQEAEVLRQRQMILMQKLAVFNRILQTEQPKKE